MEIKLFNEQGNPIPSLNFDFSEKKFSNPFIIIDLFEETERAPNIKIYDDIKVLKETKHIIYGFPIEKNEAWSPRQKYIYFLRPVDAPTEQDSVIMTKVPINHFIEIDIANRKIRISGPHIKKNKRYSEWMIY